MLAVSLSFLFVILCGIISSVILLILLHKSSDKLPEEWKNAVSIKKFRLSIYFLMIFLVFAFANEVITSYLARHGIRNGFVFSIYFTIAPVLLFSFPFIHTQSKWKRTGYLVLYSILVGYLIQGNYFHPQCLHPTTTSLLLNSIFFLIALLYLTDLLVHPKTDHFKFKLKFSLIVLILGLMADILTSFHWSDITSDNEINYPIILLLQIGNMLLFYSSFAVIFTSEIIKLLGRRSVQAQKIK